jgi:hypothetical protein
MTQSILRSTIFLSASNSSFVYCWTSRYKSAPMSRICFSAAMLPSSMLGAVATGEMPSFFSSAILKYLQRTAGLGNASC